MLNPPDTREVMVAIRPHRRIIGAVPRAASVIMNRGLIIEINHVQRAVRSDPRMNRPKPKIRSRDKFWLLASRLLEGGVSRTVGLEHFVVHQTHSRLREKMRSVKFLRPRA